MSGPHWVLLAYRLPREPSTPRIALWRALRRLGAAQLLDGLVALPADARTQEHFESLAETVVQAGGEATVWLAQPTTRKEHEGLVARMRADVGAEYRRLADDAGEVAASDVSGRRRGLRRLRRELGRLSRRDHFSAPEAEAARSAIAALTRSVDEVAA